MDQGARQRVMMTARGTEVRHVRTGTLSGRSRKHEIAAVDGGDHLESVAVRSTVTGAVTRLPASGLFCFIGAHGWSPACSPPAASRPVGETRRRGRGRRPTHADFLELILADEVTRREAKSAGLRARAAGLDPGMRLDAWDDTAGVRYDRQLWNELASLRFPHGPHGALILGPVGVGKTHMASALGHIAVRRRRTVHMAPPRSSSSG